MPFSRQFIREDQLKFAALSGDVNPMHMDASAARRTQAGAPVVHGIHILLWLLDVLAQNDANLPPLKSAKVRFRTMVYVDEAVSVRLVQRDEKGLEAEVLIDDMPAVIVTAEWGAASPSLPISEEAKKAPLLACDEPREQFIERMTLQSGKLTLPDEKALATLFPHAARYLGSHRLSALACSSYLVGMVMPGLHSIYSGLTFEVCEDNADKHAVFQTEVIDPRFNLVIQNMWGGGISANIEAFVRQPPVQQASIQEIMPHIVPGEFAGTSALIVGGSRGLGELTAKAIAAGGGKVVVSYARGKEEAGKLGEEIKQQGGHAEVIAYDVMGDAEAQLAALSAAPSHVYYFATPPLIPRPYESFSQKRYDDFSAFYVDGFERLIAALRKKGGKVRAFYPSSVAIDDPPAGMVEYAKAKEAGEALCAKLEASLPDVRIVTARLPRMLTDLTATVQPVETADPLHVMLPIIRQLQKV